MLRRLMRSTRCGALREEIPQVLKEKWNSFRVCSLCSLTPIVSAGVVGRILERCCATYCVPINITHLIYRTVLHADGKPPQSDLAALGCHFYLVRKHNALAGAEDTLKINTRGEYIHVVVK